ncbi:MAG: TlpA family protein disulfide reductase, partial [Planctomycetales bacterium]|nr:TlpA family protein disulfide reductase [Planctomycetales bacterium]
MLKPFFVFAALLLTCEIVRSADDAVLHLTNGGFVTGNLRSSDDAKTLRWQSPLFTRSLDFTVNGVNGVHYPVPPTLPKPSGEYCFELAGGDVLFGALVRLTDDEAELEVARFGRLQVRRDHIRRLYRWQGSDLIYLGPSGLSGWKELNDKNLWAEEGGQPLTDQPGASLFGDFGIPAQSVIEFELSWKATADFTLALGVDADTKSVNRAFCFEVWDGELVALRDTNQISDVASLEEKVSRPGRTHLVAYLDQEQGRMLVFSHWGTLLADLKVGLKKPRVFGGLRLTNKAGSVRLERLRISRWNGVPPMDVQEDKSRLHRNDGSTVYGKIAAFDATAKQFVVRDGERETKVPADQIASVILSPPYDMPPRAFRTVYQDGTQVSGELSRVANDHLRLTSPGIQEPLRLPLDELRSLVVLQHEDASATAASEGQAGMLELDGVRLRGRLINGREQRDASCLVWQPEQSATASPLRPDAAGRIVYREPPPPPKPVRQVPQQQPQALGVGGVFMKLLTGSQPPVAQAAAARRSLHLRSGDTVPCDVIKIDEQGLTIKTPLSDATFVAHDKIKAVELAVLPTSLKLSKSKRERLLTLPRMQKDSPPTQLICSKNGDFLRGRVLDMNDKTLRIEVRLETKEVARDRIAQIIWLHGDELTDSTAILTGERGAVRPPVDAATSNDRGPDG